MHKDWSAAGFVCTGGCKVVQAPKLEGAGSCTGAQAHVKGYLPWLWAVCSSSAKLQVAKAGLTLKSTS